MKLGQEMISGSCKITFGYVGDGDTETVFRFSYDVAFASPDDDVVILELSDQTQNLPQPLILKDTNIPSSQLHIIGHPKGLELQHDPRCHVINNQEELTKLVNDGIKFFTKKGYERDGVKEDYLSCSQSQDHVLFHCSISTTHGASGSPLIVIKDVPKVTGMLLQGHPKVYYNCNESDVPPDILVECGISTEKVKSLLLNYSLKELADDLFSEHS
jgi:hypothetical protein